MHHRRLLLFVLAFLTVSLLGAAQDAIQVDQQILVLHAEQPVYPIYPAIAKSVQIQGIVVIHVQVGKTGKIESVNVVSGNPLLQQASIDALREWKFSPFIKDGLPVVVSGTVSFEFNALTEKVSIGSSFAENEPKRGERNILKKFLTLLENCRKAISTQTDYPTAVSVCEQAADTAAELAPDVRFSEKRSAYVYAAYALEMTGDLKTALTYAGKAVDIVKLEYDDNFGSNAAYEIKGVVEDKLGNLLAADQDLTVAEDFERKGIVWAVQVGLDPSDRYKRDLAQDLCLHAQVLQGLNRPDEAQKMLDEAAKYN